MPICFSLPGYRRLYRSLLAYTNLTDAASKGLTYLLNTANIDTCREYYPRRRFNELDCVSFLQTLNRPASPYKTAVQMYKSLEFLLAHISLDAITDDQKAAVKMAGVVLDDIAAQFAREYGADIDGQETVYALCSHSFNPRLVYEPTFPLLS